VKAWMLVLKAGNAEEIIPDYGVYKKGCWNDSIDGRFKQYMQPRQAPTWPCNTLPMKSWLCSADTVWDARRTMERYWRR